MTDHNIYPEVNSLYRVGSHGDERRDIAYPNRPYRFTWGDFANKNLGAQFALAMKKLEGLMFALYGANPIYDHTAPGESKPMTWQPWERQYPRLMWGAEQWKEVENDYGDIYPVPLETAAVGGVYAGEMPCVPIRSGSGDPERFFAMTDHDLDVFPLGSVRRATTGTITNVPFPHDPAGISSELHWPTEDNVKIVWEKPGSVTLDASKDPPKVYAKFTKDGSSTYDSFDLVEDAGVYSCIMPAKAHDTWCGWHIKAFVEGCADAIYDPKVPEGAQPSYGTPNDDPEHDRLADQGYTFRWFSHYNPYGSGLPEMIDKWRKGTDRYLFDASEEIQPQLINLVRFVLERIVEEHHLQFNPRHRGGSSSVLAGDLCCFPMYIKFKWSGSNTPDLYIGGGKDDNGEPLTNHPQTPKFSGDESARLSWRGHERVWGKNFILNENQPDAIACFIAEPTHGDDETWRTWGHEIKLEPSFTDPNDLALNWAYEKRGLKEGDVIDEIHIVELIKAIDFLIDEGCWKTATVSKRKRTVSSYKGINCGEYHNCNSLADPECWMSLHGGQLACDWDNPDLNGGAGGWDAYPAPTSWEDCKSSNFGGVCNFKYGTSCYAYKCGPGHPSPETDLDCQQLNYSNAKYLNCDPSENYLFTYHKRVGNEDCYWNPGQVQMQYEESIYAIMGQFYWLCGPDDQEEKHKANDDWECDDPDHGNEYKKVRWIPTGSISNPIQHIYFQNQYSMGNKYNDMDYCKELDPTWPTPPWFKRFTPVTNNGYAPHWFIPKTACMGVDPHVDLTPLEAPGIGRYHWTSVTVDGVEEWEPDSLLCDIIAFTGCSEGYGNEWKKECMVTLGDYPVCEGNRVYVRVDLNLDSEGVPQLFPYPNSMRNPPDWRGPCRTHSNLNFDCSGEIPPPPVNPNS